MKRLLKAACLTAIAGALLSGSMTAFAGQWQQDEKGSLYLSAAYDAVGPDYRRS